MIGRKLSVLAFVVLCCGCNKSPVEAPPNIASGSFKLGTSVALGSNTVSSGGGDIKIAKSGDVLNGLSLHVEPNSYVDTRTFTISYAPIVSHTFGSNVDPISPLITISNGGDYASTPMTLRIPCTIKPGKFALAFLYDPVSGKLEGMPLMEEDSSGVTIGTMHFESAADANRAVTNGKTKVQDLSAADIVVSQIDASLIAQFVSSGFKPGVDDWQFINYGSMLTPNGECEGQTQTMMWYYEHRKQSGQPSLYNLFNGGTLGFQWDDRLGYRLASVAQTDYNSGTTDNTVIYQYGLSGQITPSQMYQAFAYAIKVTQEPQLCIVGSPNAANGGPSLHAICAYIADNGMLRVADPNNPGDAGREIDLVGGAWNPYGFGAIGGVGGTPYPQVFYWGKTAFFKWHSLSSRWSEFDNGTIGDDVFPSYILKYLDSTDNYVPLVSGMTIDSLATLLPSSIASLKLKLWTSNFTPIPGDGAQFQLPTGSNVKIGFEILDTIGAGHWVDFQWLTLKVKGANAMMPLAVGNKWVYTHQFFDTTGAVFQTAIDTLQIVAPFQNNGETWYASSYQGQAASFSFTNRVDGLYYGSALLPITEYAKYPSAVLDTFGTIVNPGNGFIQDFVTTAVDQNMVLPDGTMVPCYVNRVQLRDASGSLLSKADIIAHFNSGDFSATQQIDTWYPGVGLLQEDVYVATNSGTEYISERRTLRSWVLN